MSVSEEGRVIQGLRRRGGCQWVLMGGMKREKVFTKFLGGLEGY
jgi:hypothetical protein